MRLGFLAVLSVAALPAMAGDTIVFERIPMAVSADDITPDGRYIIGTADQDGDLFGDGTYRYDTVTGEMLILPPEGRIAAAISDDGSVIAGEMPDPADPDPVLGVVAAMWTEGNGWQPIGYLPNALECPSRSNSLEMSADGSVIVGLSWDGCSGRGFVWDALNGMRELEALANGGNRASVVSADGTVIGGFAQGTGSRTPAIWDGTTTMGQLLDPPNGDVNGEVRGISDDGTVLLASWIFPGETTQKAVKWTQSGGVELIDNGSLRPGWPAAPVDIADDGTIVGFDFLVGNRVAWIQPQGTGPILELKPWLEAAGNVFDPSDRLEAIRAISADGRRFIGHTQFDQAWMVTITPDCPADVAPPFGVLDFFDVLGFLSMFDAEDPAADLAAPAGVFDFFDVLAYLTAFDAGCP